VTRLGVIAEDKSDVEVISALAAKILGRPVPMKHFVGNGCGRIVAKCRGWSKALATQGCSALVLLHDSDERDPEELRRTLEKALVGSAIAVRAVVIPVREVEAWLLADHSAVTAALGLKSNMSRVASPEAIFDPKRRLGEIIFERSGHRTIYVNTIHNTKIANKCKPANLRRCVSFKPLERFLLSLLSL
jgi:hypothetical protein